MTDLMVVTLEAVGVPVVPFPGLFVMASFRGNPIAQSICSLNQDDELSLTQPYPSIFWAVIDFHPLPFSHEQINFSYRAFDVSAPLERPVECIGC